MANLDWLVVRDLQMIESATFWKDGPEIETGELVTEDIGTEVFFLPAASHVEKAGSFTQTQRMLQWRDKAVDPPGDARSELDFYYELGQPDPAEAGRLHRRDGPAAARPGLGLPDRRARRRRRPGGAARDQRHRPRRRRAVVVHRAEGRRLDRAAAAGSTAASTPTRSTRPGAASRTGSRTRSPPEWGWVWPANRRILYNRASAAPDGTPWSERKKYVWWDAEQGKWTGADVPDFIADRAPDYVPEEGAKGPDAIGGQDPFIMQTDGKAWLFAPSGVADGPMPTHYEPPESPVHNALLRRSRTTPRAVTWSRSVEPDQPQRQRGVPLRLHDLPAHRAPHRRRDEPHPALPHRAAAGAVLRGVAAAGRASAGSSTGGWATIVTARDGDRGAGAGDRAAAARCGWGSGSSSRSACPTTGAATASPRATRPTTWST